MNRCLGFLKAWMPAALLLLAAPGWAAPGYQAALDQLAASLGAAQAPSVGSLAVAGFVDRQTHRRSPFCVKVEEGLRDRIIGAGRWRVLRAGQDPSGADALLSGTYTRSAGTVFLDARMTDSADGRVLWRGSTRFSDADFGAADFTLGAYQAGPDQGGSAASADAGGQAVAQGGGQVVPQEPGQVVPTMPGQVVPTMPGSYSPFYSPARLGLDFSAGYKLFLPLNSTFQSQVTTAINGFTLGMGFGDVLLMDFDLWNTSVSNIGTLDSLTYVGSDFSLVWPVRLGPALTVYAGPGGRFGWIQVNDPSTPDGDQVDLGNNGFIAVAGAKLYLGAAGLDLRYTYDLAYSYTGYHTLSLGVFYDFGR